MLLAGRTAGSVSAAGDDAPTSATASVMRHLFFRSKKVSTRLEVVLLDDSTDGPSIFPVSSRWSSPQPVVSTLGFRVCLFGLEAEGLPFCRQRSASISSPDPEGLPWDVSSDGVELGGKHSSWASKFLSICHRKRELVRRGVGRGGWLVAISATAAPGAEAAADKCVGARHGKGKSLLLASTGSPLIRILLLLEALMSRSDMDLVLLVPQVPQEMLISEICDELSPNSPMDSSICSSSQLNCRRGGLGQDFFFSETGQAAADDGAIISFLVGRRRRRRSTVGDALLVFSLFLKVLVVLRLRPELELSHRQSPGHDTELESSSLSSSGYPMYCVAVKVSLGPAQLSCTKLISEHGEDSSSSFR